MSEQPAGSFTQEMVKDVLFGRERSCVTVSAELVDKDEDEDENLDADQTRTVRPVSLQSFSQLEEIGRCHGARHRKTEEQEEYHRAFHAWRDAAKELTLKRNITKVFTIVFSETTSIVNRNSEKWQDRAEVQRDGRFGTTRSHVLSL